VVRVQRQAQVPAHLWWARGELLFLSIKLCSCGNTSEAELPAFDIPCPNLLFLCKIFDFILACSTSLCISS
jgi:hypothetical protein